MMQPMDMHQQGMQHQPQHPQGGANIIVTSNGEIATGDNPNVAGERIVLQPNQRLIIVDPVTGQQKQIQLIQVPTSSSQHPPQHHILITTQSIAPPPQSDQQDGRRMSFDEYFMEPEPNCPPPPNQQMPMSSGYQQHPQQQPPMERYPSYEQDMNRYHQDVARKAKLAEAARQRYHRLSEDQKKTLNKKRTVAQKRKRQRAKEMAELDEILRQSGDIVDDPEVLEQLRERRIRARWAEAARQRYHRMTEEQRRAHNNKRRIRQMMVKNDKGEMMCDEEAVRNQIKEKNAKKAEAARLSYHRMSTDEKKAYNKRRTDSFRRRRMEEERLLSMPVGQINEEALDRAQRVVIRNAKRAEAARLRYHRMTPEQRKAYNQRRYTPKHRKSGESSNNNSSIKQEDESFTEEGLDALSSIEQEINRQTRQAQEVLKQQRGTPNPPTPMGLSNQWRSPSTPQLQNPSTPNPPQHGAQIIVQSVETPPHQMEDPDKYPW
ncbi:BMA-GEI-4, isoform b [Aphelenchoides bicaudatus]|nr:BMA-GEI-4, isoform b [Aphelenchoides bicaudatus]